MSFKFDLIHVHTTKKRNALTICHIAIHIIAVSKKPSITYLSYFGTFCSNWNAWEIM